MCFLKIGIFTFFFLVLTVTGCKWMDDIQEQIVDFKIEKEGFHRDYIINTKISSMNRFMDCKMAIKVLIPKGAYIDVVK
uniref:Lipoprotein n=1 Tax=Panagrolaimus superbus TaxID=310955 RepID=A0A914Z4C1_9BILA